MIMARKLLLPGATAAVLLAASLFGPGAVPARAAPEAPFPVPFAAAAMVHADGTPAGTVRILSSADHVSLEIALIGIPPGVHGIHLHTIGQCDAPGFTTAGGHLNPAGHQHGSDNPVGSHLGDLPNITADAKGRAIARFGLDQAPAALASALFDADGAAVVVHADPDDYRTDPSGKSGARIACGVLQRR